MSCISLIVGLGNPGAEYQSTRHNAGAWLVERLASSRGLTFQTEKKFFGLCARVEIEGVDVRLLLPTTFMNRSGQSVAAMASYFQIPVDEILIVHDELDLDAGIARFKQGGGPGGHNGVKDIIAYLGGDNGFNRLRIGIGHPGNKDRVLGHVLKRANGDDQKLIDDAIAVALDVLPLAVRGDIQRAMSQLHTIAPESDPEA
jgi:PTH1 family peptidyl-tRNA hydrolase